jgi:hypothetical protein
MCMYVSNPVHEGTPYVVHPTPADAATGYRYQTSQTANTVYANCVNTCPGHPELLSDGNCDDGGPGSEFNVCSPGTDCADCGPRQTSQVRLSDQQVGTDLTQQADVCLWRDGPVLEHLGLNFDPDFARGIAEGEVILALICNDVSDQRDICTGPGRNGLRHRHFCARNAGAGELRRHGGCHHKGHHADQLRKILHLFHPVPS